MRPMYWFSINAKLMRKNKSFQFELKQSNTSEYFYLPKDTNIALRTGNCERDL